jgi:hypothetical protein
VLIIPQFKRNEEDEREKKEEKEQCHSESRGMNGAERCGIKGLLGVCDHLFQ